MASAVACDQPVREYRPRLPNAMGAVDGLRFHCRIPPGIQQEDVFRRRQIQPQAAGLQAALLFFALHGRRHVKFAMKFLGATVFLEAADYQVQLSVEFPDLQQDLGGKGDSPPLQSDQKRIERWCPAPAA